VAHLDLEVQLQHRPSSTAGLLKEARRGNEDLRLANSFILAGVGTAQIFLADGVSSVGVVVAPDGEFLGDFLLPDVASVQLASSVGWDILTDCQ